MFVATQVHHQRKNVCGTKHNAYAPNTLERALCRRGILTDNDAHQCGVLAPTSLVRYPIGICYCMPEQMDGTEMCKLLGRETMNLYQLDCSSDRQQSELCYQDLYNLTYQEQHLLEIKQKSEFKKLTGNDIVAFCDSYHSVQDLLALGKSLPKPGGKGKRAATKGGARTENV